MTIWERVGRSATCTESLLKWWQLQSALGGGAISSSGDAATQEGGGEDEDGVVFDDHRLGYYDIMTAACGCAGVRQQKQIFF